MRKRVRNPYDNCLIESPDGTPLSRCQRHRLSWYLSRNLAQKIDENTIRLYNEPKGFICRQEATEKKYNICVVCGCTEKLTMHHIIPVCFRNAMPVEWRSGPALYHDVMVLCNNCHNTYECAANQLKNKMAKDFGILPQGHGITFYKERNTMRFYAKCLLNIPYTKKTRNKFIPSEDKKKEYLEQITKYIGHEPSTEELIEISAWQNYIKSPDYTPFGKYIVDRMDLSELVLMWRKHFLDVMKPKFLPSYWQWNRLPTEEEKASVIEDRRNDPFELNWKYKQTYGIIST